MHMLRKFRRTVNQLIRRDLPSPISEALSIREEGFFTEWKQGNTPKEKPRNPAFGGVFFCLVLPLIACLACVVCSANVECVVCALWLGIDH